MLVFKEQIHPFIMTSKFQKIPLALLKKEDNYWSDKRVWDIGKYQGKTQGKVREFQNRGQVAVPTVCFSDADTSLLVVNT